MGLAERVMAGEERAAARLMRDLDDNMPGAREQLALLYPHTGRAQIIGITGNPGSGKSTLTNAIIRLHRQAGRSVGVVAVDPSSPFSGGAILGDRIRMMEHAVDPGVFIRSLATRGTLGGLSRSTGDVVNVLDAMGKDVVLVETVGVGQDEIDIVKLADTVIVVCVPGLGDEVQAIKAGVLEIADVFVVNKADREGADRTLRELEMMLHLRDATVARAHAERMARGHHSIPTEYLQTPPSEGWEPPIVKTVAQKGEGVAEVMAKVDQHRARMVETGGLDARRRARARREVLSLAQQQLLERALANVAAVGGLEALTDRVARRDSDPSREVAAWLAHVFKA